MVDLNYSLTWDAYSKNICKGLSLLQQRGEFVDMTLAADGHLVKVHKMVMSLVSPYIKDLIASADCPHPVIFLNHVSYEILSSILEYVYTGQVMVARNQLTKFMEACKALHIKGFEELFMHSNNRKNKKEENSNNLESTNMYDSSFEQVEQLEDSDVDIRIDYLNVEPDDANPLEELNMSNESPSKVVCVSKKYDKKPKLQYSLSTQGNLQLILNRFVYNLKYSAKRSGHLTWRCVDCKNVKKCPACVTTYHDEVLSRCKPHNHPHHDTKIMKKVESGTIFTALHDAENQMKLTRNERNRDI